MMRSGGRNGNVATGWKWKRPKWNLWKRSGGGKTIFWGVGHWQSSNRNGGSDSKNESNLNTELNLKHIEERISLQSMQNNRNFEMEK